MAGLSQDFRFGLAGPAIGARIQRRRCRGACARDRCHQRDLHAALRRHDSASAVSGAGPHRDVNKRPGDARDPRWRCVLRRLPGLASAARSLPGPALWRPSNVDLTGGDRPERVSALAVTGEFFQVLGGQPLLGRTFGVQEIEEIATRRGLVLIEDAAQGLGAQSKGRPVGSLGHVSCLSFDPTKVIGSFSSAGAVVTDDPEIARRVTMQRYHGRDPGTHEYDSLGYNSQLSTEMAAMLVFKLSKMCEWEEERSAIAAVYGESLADLSQQLTLPFVAP